MAWNFENINFLATIERLLVIVIILLIMYSFFIFEQEKIGRPPSFAVAQTEVATSPSQNMLESLKPGSAYSEQLGRRDIFNVDLPAVESISQEKEQIKATQSLPSTVKIVGVLIGKPSEVIIEDTQAQQTYFVKEGETSGPFKVLDAKKEIVKLEYQGQPIEVGLDK